MAALSALKTILSPHRRLRLALEVDGKLYRLRTATFFVGNNRLQMEQIGIAPLSAALRCALGQMGRLDQADQLATYSFKQLDVKVRTLSRRRKFKVATDGEVTHMTNPLAFRVLERQLLLLKPEPAG